MVLFIKRKSRWVTPYGRLAYICCLLGFHLMYRVRTGSKNIPYIKRCECGKRREFS